MINDLLFQDNNRYIIVRFPCFKQRANRCTFTSMANNYTTSFIVLIAVCFAFGMLLGVFPFITFFHFCIIRIIEFNDIFAFILSS